MIRGLIDFALNNRWLIIAGSILLFAWGITSFHNLPVEAYPDVANNYVQIITQWPGRAAEEVEQQVTIPIEIQMAGIPHMTALRSTSLAGLSSLMLIFDDDSVNDWNREKVLERLTQVTLPPGLQPQMGTDWSPLVKFTGIHCALPIGGLVGALVIGVFLLPTLYVWIARPTCSQFQKRNLKLTDRREKHPECKGLVASGHTAFKSGFSLK